MANKGQVFFKGNKMSVLIFIKNKIVAVFNHIAEVNQRKANREIVKYLQQNGYSHIDSSILYREIEEGRVAAYLKGV